MKNSNVLLYAGMAAIIGSITNIIILGSLYPNYSHVQQFISELGMDNAPHSFAFSLIVIINGIFLTTSSLGIYKSIASITQKRLLAGFSSLGITLLGVTFIFSGIFPLPDDRHEAYGIGLFFLTTPIFMAWSIKDIKSQNMFKYFQFGAFIALIVVMLAVVLFGETGNQGLNQRIFVSCTYCWLFFTYAYLLKNRAKQ